MLKLLKSNRPSRAIFILLCTTVFGSACGNGGNQVQVSTLTSPSISTTAPESIPGPLQSPSPLPAPAPLPTLTPIKTPITIVNTNNYIQMVIVSIGNKEWDKNVRLAIDEWNDALGVDVFKETKNPSPLHSKITVTYENRASEDHFYAVGAYIVGNCLNSKITLFKNLNRYKQKTVILHELGHALGLEHSEDMSDIMYSSVSSSTNLSNNDIGRVDLEKVKCL